MKRFLLVLAVLALALATTGSSDARRSARLDLSGTTGRVAMPMIFGDRLLTINPDASGAAVLSYSHDTDPGWSPDGTALAVSSAETGNGDIYVLSPDGRQRRRLTTSDDRESDPSWAPSGYEIAFERFHGDTAIYAVDTDGSDVRLITDGPGCDEDPSFSPDGTQIAFTSCRSGSRQIYVMNSDGSNAIRVTHDDGADANPAWSPDGSRIAFDSSRGEGRRIYTIRPDGSDKLQVTIGPNDLSPAWSPDGSAIVYQAAAREAVVATTPSGSGDVVVAYGVGSPAWQPIQSDARCTYSGTDANDIVIGGAGSDLVCGGAGDDNLNGGPGADILRGGDGNDTLDARDGYPDIVDGGPGVDRAWVDRGDRTIDVEDAVIPEPRDVARGRPVSASYWWGDSPPEFAVDGLGTTGLWWGSYYAPQWIEVDLGRPTTVRRIELVVAQTPAGDTIHVIRGRDAQGNLHLLKVLARYTADNMILRVKPKRPWRGITAVRVSTVESPSWVAWKEIRVLR
jgi:dipeptidyl aminopeptidase/acylaminoacyl peptidase